MGVRWSRMSWGEKNELWQRWRHGETLDQIAQALHRGSSSIYDYVGAEGGIAPRPRRRSRLALTTTEREEITMCASVRTGRRWQPWPAAVPAVGLCSRYAGQGS